VFVTAPNDLVVAEGRTVFDTEPVGAHERWLFAAFASDSGRKGPSAARFDGTDSCQQSTASNLRRSVVSPSFSCSITESAVGLPSPMPARCRDRLRP